MFRKLLGSCTLAALLAAPGALDAKDRQGKNGKHHDKDYTQQRSRTEKRRTEREAWPRQTTKGHEPHDTNGDGVLTRHEWPGDDAAFRRLDRNGDGVLSDSDRRMRSAPSRIHR